VKLRAALAAVLVLAGVFLLLLAVDVHRWQARLAADDIVYRTDPTRKHPWSPPQILPGDLARSLLGVDDDVRVRIAFRAFKRAHARRLVFLTPVSIVHARSVAQAMLARASDRDGDARRSARELNLEGVLSLIAIDPFDPGARAQNLVQAATTFRAALASDPSNEDAAYNLELTLRLLHGHQVNGRPQGASGGSRASSTGAGSGY
jgi:hypothetical protein